MSKDEILKWLSSSTSEEILEYLREHSFDGCPTLLFRDVFKRIIKLEMEIEDLKKENSSLRFANVNQINLADIDIFDLEMSND